jgi:hypothetical protein
MKKKVCLISRENDYNDVVEEHSKTKVSFSAQSVAYFVLGLVMFPLVFKSISDMESSLALALESCISEED